MAYQQYNNNRNNNYSNRTGNFNGSRQGNYGRDNEVKEIKAEPLPKDYVDAAEKLMSAECKNITTSKIRNILALVTDIYNVEMLRKEENLLPESITKVQLMRVKVAYECGRDKKVKEFIEHAKLLEYIKGIGDKRENLINFAHYMESLVAYHRYFGGREN